MMAQRSVPAPFLTKTYHLVDDPASDDVISWNEAGTSFVVWKTAEFAKELLPIYFKHNNFSSFVRQLNTYGFRKTVAEKWEFANENFKRGQKELLAQIQRRRNGKGDDLGSTSTSTSSPDSKNPAAGSPDSFSEAVRDDQTRQVMIGDEEEKCMKLFGVVVKKRGRGWGCSDNDGPNKKRNVAWMESNKV